MQLKKSHKGMTLVEVLVVLAILGLLVGLAYPAYTSFILKSGRADARVELNDVTQRMQRCFTANNRFDLAGSCAVLDQLQGPGITSRDGFYLLTIDDLTPTAYTLIATPLGRQLRDTPCESFSLTHTGERSASGYGGADNATDECW